MEQLMDVVFEPIFSILLAVLYLLGFVAFVVELIRRMTGAEQTFAWKFAEVCLILPELIGIFSDIGRVNDCCHETAMLSPHHRLSILVVTVISVVAYFYSSRRIRLATPGIEVVVNCCLLVGMMLWVVIAFHMQDLPFFIFFSLPQLVLFVLVLAKNHALALASLNSEEAGEPVLLRWCRKILLLKAFKKIPLLLLLCLPVLVVLAGVLLLFGQQPDSMIRAFTDTYKQGLSQLDSQCIGVPCAEGHFLCSVAAGGHSGFVRPIRTGIRRGRKILCNRQLLVANAFEELLQQRLPWLHRPVRKFYNRIGSLIHRYYGIFGNKWVADLVYLLMKPLEWIFLITLYLADRRPEDRIAKQYTL